MVITLMLPQFVSAKRGKNSSQLTVISYNMRYGTAEDGVNAWEFRKPATIKMIKKHKPDILGVQEALDFQLAFILENCTNYEAVGVGRIDGKHDGEHASIMYNKRKIELLEWGNFWLSLTPDIPSIGWDAACTRTATWALLKDKKTKEKFYYVNTHLDHVGKVARKEGLSLILEKIQKINPDNFPLILTGDFNMDNTDSSIQKLNEKMIDARTSAKKTDSFGTFNGWGTRSSIIDYIYYKGFKMCTEYVTIREKYAGKTFISDHYPIKWVLKF